MDLESGNSRFQDRFLISKVRTTLLLLLCFCPAWGLVLSAIVSHHCPQPGLRIVAMTQDRV